MTTGKDCPMTPARQWTVYLVQHAHTDFGYTAAQHEMLPAHLRFIDQALDLCDATDDYPDDARFRWTCETAWAVREYLRRRPSRQIERLKRRVEEGRIELTALLFNMSEITPENGLVASLAGLREIIDVLGVRVTTAMQNDVNGMAWALPDYLSGCGVRYLTTAVHGFRSLVPFDVPTVFWWESPSGQRLLAFRPDHYFCGNWLGFNATGRVGDWVGTEQAEGVRVEEALPKYLAELEQKGYPFDRIAAQYSGHETDNSPPSMVQCDLVRAWNASHEWPKVRIATAGEFPGHMERHHGDDLPVFRAAWPDWWTDGFGSAARETGAAREAHAALQSSAGLLSMASILGAQVSDKTKRRLSDAHEAILLYDEHTFGSVDSLADPYSETTMVQWQEKAAFAWQGVKDAAMVREETWGLIESLLPQRKAPTITVFNTLNWPRSGFVRVFVEYDFAPRGAGFQIIDEDTGRAAPAQALNDRPHDRPAGHTLAYERPAGQFIGFWAADVPALGYKTFRIAPEGEPAEDGKQADKAPVEILESPFYKVEFDARLGAITSIVDKETDKELVDPDGPWRFGQFIYEDFPVEEGARHDSGRVFNRDAFRRRALRGAYVVSVSDTPIWKAVTLAGEADGCDTPNGVRVEVRLFKPEKRIELTYAIRKKALTTPEAIYVAFPFAPRYGTLVYEAQGGLARPGKDQLPRTASDWHTVQTFVTVRGEDSQVTLASPQAPLAQFGEINVGKWQDIAEVEQPHVYSWIMNNYWWTNFRAAQEGEWMCTYALMSGSDTSSIAATRFGWGTTIPLVARVSGPRSVDAGPASASLLGIKNPNLLLVQMRPAHDGNGLVVQLRELEGKETPLELDMPESLAQTSRVVEVNAIEEPVAGGDDKILFKPYETKFVSITPA